jgi:hypothetical protein
MQYAPALSSNIKKSSAAGNANAAATATASGPVSVDRNRQRVCDWLSKEISKLLGGGGEDPAIAEYVLTFPTGAERREYLLSVLGEGKKVDALCRELENRLTALSKTIATDQSKIRPLQKESESYDGSSSSMIGPAGSSGSPQKPDRSHAGTPPRSRSPTMNAGTTDPITLAKDAARQKELGNKVKVKYVKDKRTGKTGAPGTSGL